MKQFSFAKKPRYLPEYDKDFKPIILANMQYEKALNESNDIVDIKIVLVRSNDLISVYDTQIFGEKSNMHDDNIIYVERLVKTLLWLKGGWKIIFGGPDYIGEYLKNIYKPGGLREFDAQLMTKVYEKPFAVEKCDIKDVPKQNEETKALGRNLDGYRIGFDAGGSDRKVSAVVNGKAIFSEEVVWHPKLNSDPSYQYNGILESIKKAASKLPQVDAIGISAAGIYIDNRVMSASLFIKVPEDVFNSKVKNMFFDIQKEMGNVPIEIANDGDVTALAGAMSLNDNKVLGIAMGTSEAAGYVDKNGNITGWLNELAFVPVDYNANAMIDEWSGDYGCGVKYFSQDGIIKLAENAGIEFEEKSSPAIKLKAIQILMQKDDDRAIKIYQSIGCYLGYTLAYYAQFYDIKHVLLLGRVTSGKGGDTLLAKANEVLQNEFPRIFSRLYINIPDEKSRRVGQSVAAASLPKIKSEVMI